MSSREEFVEKILKEIEVENKAKQQDGKPTRGGRCAEVGNGLRLLLPRRSRIEGLEP